MKHSQFTPLFAEFFNARKRSVPPSPPQPKPSYFLPGLALLLAQAVLPIVGPRPRLGV